MPSTWPHARENATIAYDRRRGRSMLFGGFRYDARFNPTWSGETWEYRQPFDLVGPGHASNSLPLESSSLPRFGGNLDVRFPSPLGAAALLIDFSPRNTPLLTLSAPTSCQPGFVYPNPTVSVSAPGIPARYTATLDLPALLGATLLLQGVALTPAGCLQLTDAMSATIQSP